MNYGLQIRQNLFYIGLQKVCKTTPIYHLYHKWNDISYRNLRSSTDGFNFQKLCRILNASGFNHSMNDYTLRPLTCVSLKSHTSNGVASKVHNTRRWINYDCMQRKSTTQTAHCLYKYVFITIQQTTKRVTMIKVLTSSPTQAEGFWNMKIWLCANTYGVADERCDLRYGICEFKSLQKIMYN